MIQKLSLNFSDRPDLLSTEGARALRSFTEQSLGLIEYEVNTQTTHMFISKSNGDKALYIWWNC